MEQNVPRTWKVASRPEQGLAVGVPGTQPRNLTLSTFLLPPGLGVLTWEKRLVPVLPATWVTSGWAGAMCAGKSWWVLIQAGMAR